MSFRDSDILPIDKYTIDDYTIVVYSVPGKRSDVTWDEGDEVEDGAGGEGGA
jgi:hypothetical protein